MILRRLNCYCYHLLILLVVVLTGAGGGLGACCAELFAKQGALLSLVDLSVEGCKNTAKNIKESGVKNEPLCIFANIATDAKRIIDETIEKFGRLDVLVNNAAIAGAGSIETMKFENYDKIMAVNLRGPLMLTHLAVPHLIKSKGNIVNVTSAFALRPIPNYIAYSASKVAMDHSTKCIALELAEKGVRCNSVSPGV